MIERAQVSKGGVMRAYLARRGGGRDGGCASSRRRSIKLPVPLPPASQTIQTLGVTPEFTVT